MSWSTPSKLRRAGRMAYEWGSNSTPTEAWKKHCDKWKVGDWGRKMYFEDFKEGWLQAEMDEQNEGEEE